MIWNGYINKFSKKSFERSSVQYSSKRQTGIAATTTESPCELNLAESEDATIALTKGKTKAHIRIVKKGGKKERINTSTKKGKKGIPDKMVNNKNKKGEKIVRSRRHSWN
jgi:hypothetical protein